MTGTVKFFDSKNGWGIIVDAENKTKEYFVHISGTLDIIEKADEVEFTLIKCNRGVKCTDVKRIK